MSSEAPQGIIDSSDDDDEDLKLALALSLQESGPSPKISPNKLQRRPSILHGQDLVALDSDEEDDDLSLPRHFSQTRVVAPVDEAEQTPLPISGHSIFTRPLKGPLDNGKSPQKPPPTMSGHVKAELASMKMEEQSFLPTTPSKNGILGMNRAAMEAERLARVNKRKAPISPPPLQRDLKRSSNQSRDLCPGGTTKKGSDLLLSKERISAKTPIDLESIERAPLPHIIEGNQPIDLESGEHAGKLKSQERLNPPNDFLPNADPDFMILSSNSRATSGGKIDRTPKSLLGRSRTHSDDLAILTSKPKRYSIPKLTGLTFPNGIILKTWAFSYERSDDIKIEEVLQRSTLKLAVISSFQWDMEWLNSKIRNSSSTKLILVMQAKDEATKAQYREETKDAFNLRLCFPRMEKMANCMHSKLMLLSHPEYLRIAVPTANVTPYDWGETRPGAVMENSVFIIDLPRLPEGRRARLEDMTEFAKDLIYFAEAMSLSKEVVQSLHGFDFLATKGFAFVHSIGGAHTGQAWRRTGYCGLGKAVKGLGLATDLELGIDYIASSIGAINREFLATLYLAAQGDDGMREYTSRFGNQLRGQQSTTALTSEFLSSMDERFRVFFPSEDTVVNSKGGKNSAGVICFQEKWWNSPKFPSKVLRDCKSRRKDLLMHNKVCQPILRGFHMKKRNSSLNT